MMLCMADKQSNMCGWENKQYYMCRKERDAQIFKSIEQWEIEKVQNLESKDK